MDFGSKSSQCKNHMFFFFLTENLLDFFNTLFSNFPQKRYKETTTVRRSCLLALRGLGKNDVFNFVSEAERYFDAMDEEEIFFQKCFLEAEK